MGLFGWKKKGAISGDCQNGIGTFVWKSGNKYEGSWKDGVIHGKGIFTFADGGIYTGEFENGKQHGHGEMKWTNGDVFIGSYANGEPNGLGKLIRKNGDGYEGEWKNNLMHGEGTYFWSVGAYHKGSFFEDRFHGPATAEYADGRIRKGIWENDEFKVHADEIITDNVPMPWRRLPPRTGHLSAMVKEEVAKAKAMGKVPFIFYSALFANACNKMREYRRQMPEAYEGAYIIELMVDDWGAEEMNEIRYVTSIPFFMELGDDGKLTGEKALTGSWGDDTLENMREPIRKYIQDRVNAK